MGNLYSRISKRIRMTVDGIQNDCHFSVYLAYLRVADELGGRLGFQKLSRNAHKNKDQWIMQYLEKNLADVLEYYRGDENMGTYVPNAPIWVCWWTGEENAPELVKQCIRSIRKNAGTHPVYLITEKNYQEYLEIPDYMIELNQRKKMRTAHLADYIRVSLLAKYGGLWLDATIFCARQIPDEYFDVPLFTCKSECVESRFISNYRWTTFCLGGQSGHVLYRFLKEAFEEYWSKNDYAIDYLLFDYLINLAYVYIGKARIDLDAVPLNNPHRDDLQAAMNAALPAEQFESIIMQNTVLYKLSWRETYTEKTMAEQDSIYCFFLSMNIS